MGIIISLLAIGAIATIDGMRREKERRQLQQLRMRKISEIANSRYLRA